VSSTGTLEKGTPKASLFQTPNEKDAERYRSWVENMKALQAKITEFESKTQGSVLEAEESSADEEVPVVTRKKVTAKASSEKPASDEDGE
jgi:hypothetical protein